MEIRSVTIVGRGNVAVHYAKAMEEKGLEVKMLSSRIPFDSKDFCSDMIVLAVKDDVLKEVARNILQTMGEPLKKEQVAVHTSGYMETGFLKSLCENYGSFYPLQTLKKGMETDFSNVPLCTWANTEEYGRELERLAGKLSSIHHRLTDEQRKVLHLAAVFVNNFPNHLYHIADTMLEKENMDLSILYPLIDRTNEAIKQRKPYLCQTGPAFRNDKKIMQEHGKRLSATEKKIYDSISESIVNLYKD